MYGMQSLVAHTAPARERITEGKWSFLGIFALIFAGNVYVLGMLDLLPSVAAPEKELSQSAPAAVSLAPVALEEPEKIEIPAIKLSVAIANPTTTSVKVLDSLLLKGAVRYPTSAFLGDTGNVVLFGHSSYLPVVSNPAFKAFNGIQKLVAGDTITVYSADKAYTYHVRTVEKESATSDSGISLAVKSSVLTLVTCNSFAAKDDRFVVTADFVESHPIPTS